MHSVENISDALRAYFIVSKFHFFFSALQKRCLFALNGGDDGTMFENDIRHTDIIQLTQFKWSRNYTRFTPIILIRIATKQTNYQTGTTPKEKEKPTHKRVPQKSEQWIIVLNFPNKTCCHVLKTHSHATLCVRAFLFSTIFVGSLCEKNKLDQTRTFCIQIQIKRIDLYAIYCR